MFVGEEVDGRMTEFESRDVVFLENDYPTRGEIIKISNSMKWKIQIIASKPFDKGIRENS